LRADTSRRPAPYSVPRPAPRFDYQADDRQGSAALASSALGVGLLLAGGFWWALAPLIAAVALGTWTLSRFSQARWQGMAGVIVGTLGSMLAVSLAVLQLLTA